MSVEIKKTMNEKKVTDIECTKMQTMQYRASNTLIRFVNADFLDFANVVIFSNERCE